MSDFKIFFEWSEEDGCNVFTSRVTLDPKYTEMYEAFTRPPANRDGSRPKAKYRSVLSIESDFPMDTFVFFLEEDEKRFVEEYAPYLIVSESCPPKKWARPADQKGVQWCDRCKVFHDVRDPNLPPLEDEIASQLAKELADEIDNEIVADLLKIANEIRKTDS